MIQLMMFDMQEHHYQKTGDPIAIAISLREPNDDLERAKWDQWIYGRAQALRDLGGGKQAIRTIRKQEGTNARHHQSRIPRSA